MDFGSFVRKVGDVKVALNFQHCAIEKSVLGFVCWSGLSFYPYFRDTYCNMLRFLALSSIGNVCTFVYTSSYLSFLHKINAFRCHSSLLIFLCYTCGFFYVKGLKSQTPRLQSTLHYLYKQAHLRLPSEVFGRPAGDVTFASSGVRPG